MNININTHAHTHKYNHTHTHTHTFLVLVLDSKMSRAAPVHIQHVSLDLSKKKKNIKHVSLGKLIPYGNPH